MVNYKCMSVKGTIKMLSKTYVDERLQRRVVWDLINQIPYIQNILSRKIRTAIIVADIGKCLAYAKKVGCEESIQYFSNLQKDGWEYVSIDGQNRTDALKRFYNNDFSITASFRNSDDEWEVLKTKTQYKDIEGEMRSFLDMGNCLIIDVIEEMTLEELHDQYLSSNSGVQHGKMEILNCIMSKFSEAVLTMSLGNKNMFSRRLRGIKYNRMDDLLYTAQAMLIEHDRTGSAAVSISEVEEAYSTTVLSQGDIDMVESVFFDLALGLEQHFSTLGTPNGRVALFEWWGLYFAHRQLFSLYGDDFSIKDRAEFTSKVIASVRKLKDEGEIQYASRLQTWWNNKQQGPQPKKNQYFGWKISNIKAGSSRSDVQTKLAKELSSVFVNNKIIEVAVAAK